MSVKLTEEQARAIAARGRVIVSASAGSGKTFVMIERLVSLITEGADVTRTLAVTFTKKAASQMRERLRSALIKKLSESSEKERARLKAQLSALPLADISTIHAFCARLVRTHFYLVGVDPAFRVIDAEDHEGALILARALDEVFEWGYETDDPGFKRLLSVYFRNKKDAKLREILLSLYAKLRERADYTELLETMGEADEFADVCEFLASDVRDRARFIAREAREQAAYFAGENPKAAAVMGQVLSAAEALLSGDLFALAAREMPAINNMPPSTRAAGETLYRLKYGGKLSAAVKELYQRLAKFSSREEEYARYLDGRETSRALGRFLLRFDEAYSRYKNEAGVLDYNDLEHCAIKVLENGEARAAVREKYRYVFVDEYQDVNPAQERILSLICGDEVFLVGDAKQSIYAFRGSRSDYFVNKCREYDSLLLTENFRSAPAILECVNRVFSRSMTEKSAGIAYREAPMRGGKRYGGHSGGVFFHNVPAVKEEKRERGVYSVLAAEETRADPQAELVCRLIEEEVGSEWFDADAGVVRPLGFGDIAILVRAGDSGTENIIAALSARDVPVSTAASVNVCDFWEARLLIDWLSFLDNGEQDIPFAGALLSRIGGFTDGELARIRLQVPHGAFREACREYAERRKREKNEDGITEKLNTFAQKVARYRDLMRVKTAAEMIALLLADGLEAEIAAKKDGDARLRRVLRLAEEADGSVNAFLRRLKTLNYRVKYAEGGGENAVKVVTMHSSKGLEYPVVFLVGLDTAFRGSERDEVLYTDRFLFAPKSFDLSARTVRETVLRRASLLLEDRETVKGELNLLYVAMTRAKFRLHMFFRERKSALAPEYAERFSDFIDLNDCAGYFVPEGESREAPLPRSALVYRADGETLEKLRAVYEKPYRFEDSACLPVKSSATAMLRTEREDAPAPAPAAGGGGATVEQGLAYHAFLEHVRFGESARNELSRMERDGTLSAAELALLDEEKLQKILDLPSVAALKGKRVWREQTFLVSLPACALPALKTSAEDEIVLQGALDLLCEDEAGYLILDYKYSSHAAERLKEDYAPQIDLYRKAVAKIKGVDERTIRARLVNLLGLFEVEM